MLLNVQVVVVGKPIYQKVTEKKITSIRQNYREEGNY